MIIKDKLPVSYLLFTSRGRISRSTYWMASVFTWSACYILFNTLTYLISPAATWVIYPLLFWALAATAIKRLHDISLPAYALLLVLVPVAGPLLLFVLLGFKKGARRANRFGADPRAAPDYFTTSVAAVPGKGVPGNLVINDITQLNPVTVSAVAVPESIAALQEIIRNADRPVSIGGGRFSMGGQTASAGSLHIDLRRLNAITAFSAEDRLIKVEAGTRWCDIQRYIDPYGLSVKIMQTYANFTAGGALSVNCHGRYIGLGPIILSVRSLDLVMASGELISASPKNNPDLFFASIGCYNAVAVIVAAELELADNVPVERFHQLMGRHAYRDFFFNSIRQNKEVIFHNGDLYPPFFRSIRAVSWITTNRKPTVQTKLMPLAAAYPLERYFIGAFSKSRFGKWRRQFIYDPLLFRKKKVHWRNYEAGYDVAELEPQSRKQHTYVLQEYFVPVNCFDAFAASMTEIFTRHHVNVINVSVRHAQPDNGSLLAWAREEVFAFVIWYKQRTDATEKNKVGVWTRELIEAAISLNGAYYLPYQAHATCDQFHRAYPRAKELMKKKALLDPTNKFRNIIWDKYYSPTMTTDEQ